LAEKITKTVFLAVLSSGDTGWKKLSGYTGYGVTGGKLKLRAIISGFRGLKNRDLGKY